MTTGFKSRLRDRKHLLRPSNWRLPKSLLAWPLPFRKHLLENCPGSKPRKSIKFKLQGERDRPEVVVTGAAIPGASPGPGAGLAGRGVFCLLKLEVEEDF